MMVCTREVPEVEFDCGGDQLQCFVIGVRDLCDKANLVVFNWGFAGEYINALKHSTQEEVRQCILEACE